MLNNGPETDYFIPHDYLTMSQKGLAKVLSKEEENFSH